MLEDKYLLHIPADDMGLPGVVVDSINADGVFHLVGEAIDSNQPLSIVRMSDGEALILDYCLSHNPEDLMLRFPDEWNIKYGVKGITCGEIQRRMTKAALECTYFAPDGWMPFCGGFVKYFPLRMPFARLHFHHEWTHDTKRELFAKAKKVMVIHRDPKIRELIADPAYSTGAKFCWIPLSNWLESVEVIRVATSPAFADYPLVLVSPGAASKYIVPEIARLSNKVVLDIGSGASIWWNEPYY